MAASALERLVRRDRLIVAAALALIALLAWAYVVHLVQNMHMTAQDASMAAMIWLHPADWSSGDAFLMFAMWAVMMVAMMTPSVAPMVLVHARVARHAREREKPFAATGWFVAGYLLAWTAFAAVATAAQWALEFAMLLTPTMALGNSFGGAVLIAAGLYQWTRLKDACLKQCQSPLVFIQRHGLPADVRGSLVLGTQHGIYCIGCCWALMLLLFVGGIMNLLWIAGLAVFVLLEKVLPASWLLSRAVGMSLITAGVWLVATP